MKTRSLFIVAVGLIALFLTAADWPQWRGPQRDGISQETGLLKEWPAEGPKLLWQRKDLGEGYSTPSVVGQRLYVLSNKGMENELVQCLETNGGREVWSTRIGKVGPNRGQNYPGARSTPTVDGDLLFALGSDGDLACLETASGKIIWQKNLRNDFGGKTGNWAYAESPLIDGEVLVCTPGGSEATLVALRKKSGDVIWKSAVPEADQAAYASIVIAEANGSKQYVQLLQKGLVGIDAKTGKFLWRYDRTVQGSPAHIPTPVAQGRFVYTATARGGGALVAIKPGQGALDVEEIFFSQELPKAIGGAVLVKGHLYGTNSGGLMCVDFATGDVKWQKRGIGIGSVCYSDGCLYIHAEDTGEVALVEATPEAYREKGRFTPPGIPGDRRGKAWAYPVVANGRLYVRDWGCLWCYDIKAPAGQ
jgi:outer membrane protein assembly factor BamB